MKLNTNFFRNDGIWVSVAAVSGKLLFFLLNIFLIRYLPVNEFGLLTIVLNFVGFFLPAVGLGSSHGVLRFGAAEEDPKKPMVFSYALQSGFIAQLILSLIFVLSAFLMRFDNRLLFILSIVMLVRLFGTFYLEQAKAELRANFNNKKYSQLEIFSNIIAFVLGIVFTLLWGIWGYVISLCVFPFSVFFFYRFKKSAGSVSIVFKKEFWNYSLKSVLTILVFMWLFLLDIFFIGRYFSLEDVAFYKISILIPMNIFFVSQIYTQTLYPEMCKNQWNRNYLKTFIKNYYLIFIPIAAVFLGFGFFFSKEILLLLGVKTDETGILRLMFLQMASIMLFRIPFGNLMGAMGYMGVSLAIGIFMLAGIIITSLVLLPGGSPITMAYISLFFITLGGLIAGIFFYSRLIRLKNESL